jgi:hypothetical protein
MEAMLVNARFSGLIHGLVVNDIELAPLIDAEMMPKATRGVSSRAVGPRPRSARAPRRKRPLRERVDGEW